MGCSILLSVILDLINYFDLDKLGNSSIGFVFDRFFSKREELCLKSVVYILRNFFIGLSLLSDIALSYLVNPRNSTFKSHIKRDFPARIVK